MGGLPLRILLVEDDVETQTHIANSLVGSGYVVETAATGREGLQKIAAGAYELLIIDRMMPEIDGLSLVKAVRAMDASVPILILTAMGAVADRVAGLEAGADDYLVKPFSLVEMSARVAALGRRHPMSESNAELRAGGLTLDRLKREVRRGSRVIDLQPREFQLLELLMLNTGRVVTRTMMLEIVWDLHFNPGTNIVESHISRIRSKVDEGDESLIQTVRGAGYVFRDH